MKNLLLFIFIILLSIFIIPNLVFSQDIKQYAKDPQLAFTLSIIEPAYGQFYIGNPSMGILYWFIDKMLIVSSIYSVFDIEISFPADIGINIQFQLRNLNTERIIAVSVFGALFIAFRVFSSISSMNGALLYNKELLDDNNDYIYNGENFDILYIIDYNSLGVCFKFDIF